MNLLNNVKRKLRKIKTGIVVSNCQNKTIVIKVIRFTPHSLYKKIIKSTKKYYVHDENNLAKIGDKVCISETRPYSKTKRWRLIKII